MCIDSNYSGLYGPIDLKFGTYLLYSMLNVVYAFSDPDNFAQLDLTWPGLTIRALYFVTCSTFPGFWS